MRADAIIVVEVEVGGQVRVGVKRRYARETDVGQIGACS
jgi:hypothetical protein